MRSKLIVVVPEVVGDRPRWWLWRDADNKYERGSIGGDCAYALAHICDDLHTTEIYYYKDRPVAAIISIEVGRLGMTDDGIPDELELCAKEQR